MSNKVEILSFTTAIDHASLAGGKRHILLGNWFSIGAHEKFRYGTLYEQAVRNGMSKQVVALFNRYGTANFEEVLRQLDEGQWMAEHYQLQKSNSSLDMSDDYEQVKRALVAYIATNHPEGPGSVQQESLDSASTFLKQFDTVFTTNYDLLLYWASLFDGLFPFEDGFGREVNTDDDYCVFLPTGSSNKHIYFLHGALHLYTQSGEVRKRVWINTGLPLMEQIRSALDERRYPLIVSEGDSASKGKRIEASSYLSHCVRRFENIQGNLFVYGSALSEQDEHILDWIATNSGLAHLFVGVHGDANTGAGAELIGRAQSLVTRRQQVLHSPNTGRRFKKTGLQVSFFRSETADVWAAPSTGDTPAA